MCLGNDHFEKRGCRKQFCLSPFGKKGKTMRCFGQHGEGFEKGGGENQCQMPRFFFFFFFFGWPCTQNMKFSFSISVSLLSLQLLFFESKSSNIVTDEINEFVLSCLHTEQYFFFYTGGYWFNFHK